MSDPRVLRIEHFLPRVHPRAMGLAVAINTAAGIAFLTAFHIVADTKGLPLALLGEYFPGYSVTWSGALAGVGWAALGGYAAGWLLAMLHNATLAISGCWSSEPAPS